MRSAIDKPRTHAVSLDGASVQPMCEPAAAEPLCDTPQAERARIGRNLHDSVCQELAGVAMLADRLARRLEQQDAGLCHEARAVAEGVRQALRDVRSAMAGLLPVDTSCGLSMALARLGADVRQRYQIRCEVKCSREVADPRLGGELYLIASEAVSNAARHSGASRIFIRVRQGERGIVLEVSDSGKGMAENSRWRGGRGLVAMEQRARALGGRLELATSRGGGTRVRCEVPENGIPHAEQ